MTLKPSNTTPQIYTHTHTGADDDRHQTAVCGCVLICDVNMRRLDRPGD